MCSRAYLVYKLGVACGIPRPPAAVAALLQQQPILFQTKKELLNLLFGKLNNQSKSNIIVSITNTNSDIEEIGVLKQQQFQLSLNHFLISISRARQTTSKKS